MACAVSEVHLKPGRLSCLSLKNIPLIAEGRHDVKCVQTLMGPEKSCTCPIKESKVRQKLQLSLGQSEQRGLGLPFLNEDSEVKTLKRNGHMWTSPPSLKVAEMWQDNFVRLREASHKVAQV